MPVVKILDLAYCRMAAPDLDAMEGFLSDFGTSRAARTSDTLYMRGTGDAHHVHVTQRGPAAFLGSAFSVASHEDLKAAAQLPGASAVHAVDEPGGGERVLLRDPNGYQVELLFGAAKVAELPIAVPVINTAGQPQARAGGLVRLQGGPSRVRRIGHVVMVTPRLAETIAWYQRTLGMLPSDEVYADSPDNIVGSFNRCDRGSDYVDHHVAMFFSGAAAGLNHVAFEVNDMDDLFTGHEHLAAKGRYEHMFGIGRHLIGSQVFDYWADPWGRVHEHWTDTDRLNVEAPRRVMPIHEGFVSQWGGPAPEKLLTRVSA